MVEKERQLEIDNGILSSEFQKWLKQTIIINDKGEKEFIKGIENFSESELLEMYQHYEEQMILDSITDEMWAEYNKERLAEPFFTFDE